MDSNKSYRIRFNKEENYANISLNLTQDIDVFEVLSLKIDSKNFYKLQRSNYGCVAGRVLANNAVGVPNVKLSIFISADESTSSDSVLNSLYPYGNTQDTNYEGIRYNLLTEEELSECHQAVGTFPSKRLVLDDNNVFEIFDKYYKFTTTTNNAGDYMIFGVPTGSQILHMDVDLSDIGPLLSQTPRDFIYKGYDKNLFENPSKFKKSTDLGSLPQIMSQDENVFVYPFWGDPAEMMENDSTGVRITRKDINISYKFEPTCVFIGSIISDDKSNGFSEKCVPTDRMGKMNKITTGEGTIEMIRESANGDIESFNISGTHLIDGDGTWCYQIPMNLDYIRSDENGNIVPSDNPNEGIPTRTRVRFRISINDFASDYEYNHVCKALVPNNPDINDTDFSERYVFGTNTKPDDFRDLLWNKVYSVKSYVPRIQKGGANREKRFSGIKSVNVSDSNNPIPYNNIRVDITFMFILQCAIINTLIWIVTLYNKFLCFLLGLACCDTGRRVSQQMLDGDGSCLTIGDGMCPDMDGWYFAPGCDHRVINTTFDSGENFDPLEQTQKVIAKRENNEGQSTDGSEVAKQYIDDQNAINIKNKESESICVSNKIDYFVKCIELALAQEYEVINFDFYNDWLNGVLYVPRWFAKVRKRRTYFFGLIKAPEKVFGCTEENFNLRRRYIQQCALDYEIKYRSSTATEVVATNEFGCVNPSSNGKLIQKCHKGKGRKEAYIFKKSICTPGGGIVHAEETSRQQHVYYLRPCDVFTDSYGRKHKVNYFATDIILLGSLIENDIDGIPVVGDLTSSTFKMPTNLAHTNIDVPGYMFGAGSTITHTCGYPSQAPGGKATVDIENAGVANNTFEGYTRWAQGTDYDTMLSSDASEYPMTEASGIDWGYNGPEQSDLLEKYSNYSNVKYFQPGGHFLGISCFNAETNIKTCVNLSRICEIGVSESRRKPVMKLNPSETDVFVIPTGFVSKFDISDSDFRSVFATLNHNDLKTTADTKTGRYVYSFIPKIITGFEGSYPEKYLGWQEYNKKYDWTSVSSSDHLRNIYTTAGEKLDKEYYDFRLGLNNSRLHNISDVYLNFLIMGTGDARASLPMYNNSFYFYFGLHDGATALDKFYENYFSKCSVDIDEEDEEE